MLECRYRYPGSVQVRKHLGSQSRLNCDSSLKGNCPQSSYVQEKPALNLWATIIREMDVAVALYSETEHDWDTQKGPLGHRLSISGLDDDNGLN
ncbi:hypothetical protein TNCV_3341341 [Trichonephila clavipes]|nr:hypothetical protein TNCV_3341341 [Trichonephila clavipes]